MLFKLIPVIIAAIVGILVWQLPRTPDSTPSTDNTLPDRQADQQGGDQQADSMNLESSMGSLPEETVAEGYVLAPCATSSEVEADIVERHALIDIQLPKHPRSPIAKRRWQDVVQRRQTPRSLTDIKASLRTLLIELYKTRHPTSWHRWGASLAGDREEFIRFAICDELCLVHHQVEGGIHPAIDEVDDEMPKASLSPEDRALLQRMYRSCLMTSLNAFRYFPSYLARVTYAPTPDDEKIINAALNIDPNRREEVICLYRVQELGEGRG